MNAIWVVTFGSGFGPEVAFSIGRSLVITLLILIFVRFVSSQVQHLRETVSISVIEVTVTIVGILAAVVMAFILFAVWNRFEQAKTLCDQESAEVMTIYRLSKRLPNKGRPDDDYHKLISNLQSYLFRACYYDWNAMSDPDKMNDINNIKLKLLNNNKLNKEERVEINTYNSEADEVEKLFNSTEKFDTLFAMICDHVTVAPEQILPDTTETEMSMIDLWDGTKALKTAVADGDEQSLKDKITDHLATLSSLRTQRMVMSQTLMPKEIWWVLITAAIVLTIAICVIWVERFPLHLFNALLLAGIVTLVLETTAQIDNPFQGDISVKPIGLLYTMKRIHTDQLTDQLTGQLHTKAASVRPLPEGGYCCLNYPPGYPNY